MDLSIMPRRQEEAGLVEIKRRTNKYVRIPGHGSKRHIELSISMEGSRSNLPREYERCFPWLAVGVPSGLNSPSLRGILVFTYVFQC
jgi:hypothetical protein